MKDYVIGIIAVIVIAAIVTILIFPGLGGVLNVVLNRQDLSKSMHALIDPINPTLLEDGIGTCEESGGTPRDDATAVGCFDMDPGHFDVSQCSTAVFKYIQAQCEAISGAKWVCGSTGVGCSY